MIEYLYVNNFRSLVNFRVEFDNISVLIGKNGSGKTSLITAISFLQKFIAYSARVSDILNKGFLTKWMNSNIQTFEMGLSVGDRHYCYYLEVEYEKESDRSFAKKEMLRLDGKVVLDAQNGKVSLFDDGHEDVITFQTDPIMSGVGFGANVSNAGNVAEFKNAVMQLITLKIDPVGMQDRVEKETAIPDVFFHNIVAVYTFLTQVNPEAIQSTWRQMKAIDPTFMRTRIAMGIYGKALVADYQYHGVEVSYGLLELSEGERMLLALYILLYGYVEQGYTIIIDEPDNYVSLREIQPWCSLLQMTCEEKGQCVLISHHPEVIDFFAKDAGIWLKRLASGESAIWEAVKEGDDNTFLKYSEMIAGGYLDEA